MLSRPRLVIAAIGGGALLVLSAIGIFLLAGGGSSDPIHVAMAGKTIQRTWSVEPRTLSGPVTLAGRMPVMDMP